jgi:multiple sugar transport system substrate-binding protein
MGAISAGASLLIQIGDWRWGLGSVLTFLIVSVMTGVSAVGFNLLPKATKKIWRLKRQDSVQVVELLSAPRRRLLQHPLRTTLVTLVVVSVIVGAGVLMRPEPTGLEPGELVVMTAFPSDPNDARSMVLDQWNRLNPDNQARFDYAPESSDAQHDRMVDDAKPGGEHRADLYVLDIVWMREFTARDYVRPLDESKLPERDLGDFVRKPLATCLFDGKTWGLPFNSDVGLMYQREIGDNQPTPRSWDDYYGTSAGKTLAMAKKVDPKIEAANAAQLSVDDEMLTINTLEAIWAAGGRLVQNGQPTMTADLSQVDFGPEDLAGIRDLAKAANDSDVVLTKDHEARASTARTAAKAFSDGRTLYMRNWPVARDAISDDLPYKVVAPPTPSVLGGQDLTIAAHTDKPRAAQALIQFLTNPSSEQIISEAGGFVPTRQSAFDYSRDPDSQQVQTALNNARLRPVTEHYVEFSKAFRQGIAQALSTDGELEDDFGTQLARILNRP